MLTVRAAASLLEGSHSLTGLVAIAHCAGCTSPAVSIDVETRAAFGFGNEILEAALVAGPGALRAIAITVRGDASLREVLARTATHLNARTATALWMLVIGQPVGTGVAVAAWRRNSSGRRTPRIAALVADRTAVVDSDADTVRALAAAAADDDLTTHARWIDVLGREALSRRFFGTLDRLIGDLANSTTAGNAAARSEIALLYASRLLFLAFLEAKGWLDSNRDFMAHHFDACMLGGGHFHGRVLLPLFFGTLNTPASQRAPRARRFGRVPFLNGGLFTPTAIERQFRHLRFADVALGAFFSDLFGRYRFTVHEESSTFQEAAIDPEMLGRTFESLMAARSRHATGAFYTPHELVERVATTGLEDALALSLGDNLAASVIQGTTLRDDERHRARAAVAGLTILDPACGSGAFLVHLLDRISSLTRELGDDRSLDTIRRETLTHSIFGVDLNPTAIWLCELRLWLAVVIEARDDAGLSVPPLPNLDRNIRVGNALVGDAFSGPALLRPGGSELRRLRDRYVRATGPRKHAMARALDREERRLVVAAFDAQLRQISDARRDVVVARRGRDLFGERNTAGNDLLRRATELRRRSAVVRATRARLIAGGALPFSFPAYFADVAADGGFGLVVGNPPWVRPHRLSIADREAYRRSYRVARGAAWVGGAAMSGAGVGFAAQVDLAALFVERSLDLTRPGGTASLLVPAKLWRSLSGGGVRHLLMDDARLRRIEDYSDARATFDASVYPGLLVARSAGAGQTRGAQTLPAVAKEEAVSVASEVSVAVTHRSGVPGVWRVPRSALSWDVSPGAPWLLLPPEVRRAFDRLTAAGTPMGESAIGRAHLGVKCGLNDAFLLRRIDVDGDEAVVVGADGRAGRVERSLLRPVARGEDVTPWCIAREDRFILWTHDAAGVALPTLPHLAARWLDRSRRALAARVDARTSGRWWTLFRTEAARASRPRVIWADLGRTPRAAAIAIDDAIVPLNSCYVAHCRDTDDAFALATLLNSSLAAAWLNVLAEPARGGYRRFLGWTMSLFPVPSNWESARIGLSAIGRAATVDPSHVGKRELLDAVLHAYGVRSVDLAPLLAWCSR